MGFTVARLDDEPIVIVTLQDPIIDHDAIRLTRHVVRETQDIDGIVYRVTDLRDLALSRTMIETCILPDIHFTSWRVRSVVVGVGEMVDYLVAFTNHHFYQQFKVIAFPCLESALAHLRWEIKTTISTR